MRYYSTQRPITPGCCPRINEVSEIHNFDEKTFCEKIGMEAWGYIDYNSELSDEEAAEYELLPENLKTFWAVTTAFYDDGRVVSNITSTIKAVLKPENVCKSLARKDIYVDWFESEEEALAHVEEARNC